MSRQISMTWSAGVTEEESGVFVATVNRTLRWLFLRVGSAYEAPPLRLRVFGNWIIPALAPDSPYWGTQWYVDASYDASIARVIGPEFLELVRQEPWQHLEPHFDLALLDQDLTNFPAPLAHLHREHYALGTSFPGTAAVMSVQRLRTLADERMRLLALARLVRHHLGHALGVPDFRRQEQVARLGLEMHCTNPCVMRHADTVQELSALALEETELGWAFCPACTTDLLGVIVRHAYVWS